MSGFNSLANINIELTNKCNKNCWMCGRRKVERDYPELVLEYDDMEFSLLSKIASQVPERVVVQLHNNGEPLMYPRFGDAVKLFKNNITNIVTNGKLLLEKADEIIDNLDTLSISIFEDDTEAEEQYEIIKEFFKIKGDRKPFTTLRLIGNVDRSKYEVFDSLIITRTLHKPMGSFGYRREPTIPEIGICWDFLNHLAINTKGEVSICVRFDPEREGVIGNLNSETLEDIWNGSKRLKWLELHKSGKRDEIPLCSKCHFWGVPTGV
ncbi:radical SAM/SPASM domain-containing protein [Methanolobus sp. WCC1]|uniref:SPASM domain-containing protein n=1 Tax=unclassified Methanolobus TaxID=2629569 RepID=UPI00324D1F31